MYYFPWDVLSYTVKKIVFPLESGHLTTSNFDLFIIQYSNIVLMRYVKIIILFIA